jgi:hypothetical protein
MQEVYILQDFLYNTEHEKQMQGFIDFRTGKANAGT